MESKLSAMTGTNVADSVDVSEDIFRADMLVNELVVQRSRAYVKRSLSNEELSLIHILFAQSGIS